MSVRVTVVLRRQILSDYFNAIISVKTIAVILLILRLVQFTLNQISQQHITIPLNLLQVDLRCPPIDVLLQAINLLLGSQVKFILFHIVDPRLQRRAQMIHKMGEVSPTAEGIRHNWPCQRPPQAEAGSDSFVYMPLELLPHCNRRKINAHRDLLERQSLVKRGCMPRHTLRLATGWQ